MPTIPLQGTSISHEEAFRQSEASVKLEGIDPTAYPEYVALRDRVLAGEITSDQAVDLLLDQAVALQTTAA
jgi:Antitoxin VbhA